MTKNMASYLAVFDCDGTIVDSAGIIVEAMHLAWRAENISSLPTPRFVRSIIGLDLLDLSLIHI